MKRTMKKATKAKAAKRPKTTAKTATGVRAKAARAGGQPFRTFSLDELTPVDNTTPVRQLRGTGLVLAGARTFRS